MFYREGSQAVPEIIQSENRFPSHAGRLVDRVYERTSEFDHFRQVIGFELIWKTEKFGCRQVRFSFGIER